MFKIETFNPLLDQWTDDASLLGLGCTQDDNLWSTKADALVACDQMATACGFSRHSLRVVPVI
jgi:hypothetical protein